MIFSEKMIYVAGPYYHEDSSVIESRMTVIYQVMAALTQSGKIPVSPMLMHEVVKRHDLPNTFEFWKEYSFSLLRWCSAMQVVRLPGWEESKGVTAEIQFCKEHKIPIYYDYTDLDYKEKEHG